MGKVKDIYIHYENTGDKFIGRTVTETSSLSKKFNVSPIIFDFGNDPQK